MLSLIAISIIWWICAIIVELIVNPLQFISNFIEHVLGNARGA